MDDLFFPNHANKIKHTSEATPAYNCVSWALGYNDQVIWPDSDEQHRWPPNLARDESVANFTQLLTIMGFWSVKLHQIDQNLVTVAMFTSDNFVTHLARKLPGNDWESKLGSLVDVSHDELGRIYSQDYGTATHFFQISGDQWPPTLPPLHPPPAKFVALDGTKLF